MRHLYTAQDQVAPLYQAVYIVALTNAQGREVIMQECFCHLHVLRCRQLDIAAVAQRQPHRNIQPFNEGSVICADKAGLLRLTVRFADNFKAEALRRLNGS